MKEEKIEWGCYHQNKHLLLRMSTVCSFQMLEATLSSAKTCTLIYLNDNEISA